MFLAKGREQDSDDATELYQEVELLANNGDKGKKKQPDIDVIAQESLNNKDVSKHLVLNAILKQNSQNHNRNEEQQLPLHFDAFDLR